MEDASEIYTAACFACTSLIEEKIDTLAELYYFLKQFEIVFKNNPHLREVLYYITYTYLEMLKEANREHELYSNIIDYLASLPDIEEFKNTEVLKNLSLILNTLDDSFCSRTELNSYVKNHYSNILNTRYLDENNVSISFDIFLTDEAKTKLKELIPEVKTWTT